MDITDDETRMASIIHIALETAKPGGYAAFDDEDNVCKACLVGEIINLITGSTDTLKKIVVEGKSGSVLTNPIMDMARDIGFSSYVLENTLYRFDKTTVDQLSTVLCSRWPTAGHLRRHLSTNGVYQLKPAHQEEEE